MTDAANIVLPSIHKVLFALTRTKKDIKYLNVSEEVHDF